VIPAGFEMCCFSKGQLVCRYIEGINPLRGYSKVRLLFTLFVYRGGGAVPVE
jgi:hypothetical protein